MNLNQLTIPALDVEKSVAFYELLGLQLIVLALPEYARFECPQGDSTFSIHRVEKLPDGDGVWIYFEKDQLDHYIDSIKQKGIIIDELPEDKPWLWREARLKDPDNNCLIIYQAGKNRKNPPWRIKNQENI